MALARRFGTPLLVVAGIALAAYPLLVYAALGRYGPAATAAALATICVVRLVVVALSGRSSVAGHGLTFVCIGGAILAAVGFYVDSAVLFYPVLVNAILLTVFGASLFRPPPIVERIARIRKPALPAPAVAYTRRVTIVWTAFFALNGAIALYTAVATPLATWALYNGLIAYVLIGVLFLAELTIRTAFKARLKQ